MSQRFNRRQFFKLFQNPSSKGGGKDGKFVRPPGANADDEIFLSDCTKCGDCAKHCPHDAIVFAGPKFGKNEGTPYLRLEEKPCYMCSDFPCIASCKDGALTLERKSKPIAKVFVDENLCLNHQGTLCDECQLRCPTQFHAIKILNRKVYLDESLCSGCGLCVGFCPAEPLAFAYEAP